MKIPFGKNPWRFGAGLLMIRGFIGQLVSLLTITQQDLKDAGIYHR